MMLRTVLIVGLLAMMLPAAADARTHTVDVKRGETVIIYDGSGSSSHSSGYYCRGTEPCLAFGVISYSASWEATAIADRAGHVAVDDTTLSAHGLEDLRPDEGDPHPSPHPTACSASLRDKNGRYRDGVSATTTAGSIGLQVTLPVDSNWLELQSTTDPAICRWGTTGVTAGAVLGAQGYGPQDDEPAAQEGLARVLAPKMAIRRSARTATRKFDFLYHRAPPHSVGPYSLTVINIESTVTVVNRCQRFDETHRRCVAYYHT